MTTTKENSIQLNTIEEALSDLREGKIIIVVDDEDRENEGDFICAAEIITPEMINFMATHGRGLICTPMEISRAEALDLPLMVSTNTALHETAFTVSIDLIGHGCSTGISAYDRATGIRHLTRSETQGSDFARPGHIFPLRAKPGGVLRRTGHTEAAVDLARMAGFYPMGVLVEILNEDGSMARLPQLVNIAKQHDLKIISIDDLVAYRMRKERLVRREISVTMPSPYGDFEVIAFTQLTTGDTHLAICKGTWTTDESVPVRVHSSSETGDILGMLFEGYNKTLESSMKYISEVGKGVMLYMCHGEKSHSLTARLHAYKNAQNKQQEIRPDMDQRDYGIGAQILHDIGIGKICLLTRHPKRRIGLMGYGLEITDYVEMV